MPVEHVDITDPEIHEPKGVASAAAGEVYIADGAGSGSWKSSGWNVHGEMVITGNTTAQSLTAASDATLATDSDYVKVTTGWSTGHVEGITFNVDELVVPEAGEYEVSFWASIKIATNNATVAVKYAVNDTTPYSTRKVMQRSDAANDITCLSAVGIVTGLSASDTISMYVASDLTGNVTFQEAGILVKLLDPA